MKWIKVTDVLTHSIPETFIRYDQGQQKVIGDHVTIRDIWENGWNDIEYLDESPSSDPAEVLVKALEFCSKSASVARIHKVSLDALMLYKNEQLKQQ